MVVSRSIPGARGLEYETVRWVFFVCNLDIYINLDSCVHMYVMRLYG